MVNMDTFPRAFGVSRMFDNEKALLVCFERRPTDDELRNLQDLLAKRAPESSPPVPETEVVERAVTILARDRYYALRGKAAKAEWEELEPGIAKGWVDEARACVERLAASGLLASSAGVEQDWMKELAKEVRNVLRGHAGVYTGTDDLVAIIARHAPPSASEKEIVEALEPFAEKAAYCDEIGHADGDYAEVAPFTAGVFRRAARVLLKLRGRA